MPLHIYSCIWDGLYLKEALIRVFIFVNYFTDYYLNKCSWNVIIESIPTTLRSAISAGIGVFLAYVGIKNAGLLWNSHPTPGNLYDVAGEGADKAQAAPCCKLSSRSRLGRLQYPAVLVALAGLAISSSLLKASRWNYSSILTTTVLAIAVGKQ